MPPVPRRGRGRPRKHPVAVVERKVHECIECGAAFESATERDNHKQSQHPWRLGAVESSLQDAPVNGRRALQIDDETPQQSSGEDDFDVAYIATKTDFASEIGSVGLPTKRRR
jgi:hypothetical protein